MMPQPQIQISIRESGNVTIVDLRGRWTIDGAAESELLSRRLKELVANGARTKYLLNLEDLTKIDSSGVSIIVETHVSLRAKGGELKLLRPCGHVLEVFRLVHLLELIPSFEDETQALASFRPLLSYSASS